MDYTIDAIAAFVRWLCRKLDREQLLVAVTLLLEVINDQREDIRPRDDFRNRHPQYRRFTVDREPPLLEAPPQPEPRPTLDWRELRRQYRIRTGRDLKPIVRRANSYLPPAGAHCERCSAPEPFLYVNDGKVGNQLRCKVCDLLFPSHRCRRESDARYWCPHCGRALYRWKDPQTIDGAVVPLDDLAADYAANLREVARRVAAGLSGDGPGDGPGGTGAAGGSR